ncbi:hypothetical protein AB4Y36_39115 [Paraburkholderia sp. BR10936]|uniref:hypothetical protein n=1 Tax=Paraburkholderia sp. BR10936 TaxID=3236993 RepID=UPI0034D2F053
MADTVDAVEMHKTDFDSERLAFHEQMAGAYHGFLHYTLVANAGNEALYKGMREFRNKFLSSYFIENAPVAPLFGNSEKVRKKYGGAGVRRYLVADYYSHEALKILRTCRPLARRLCFEHILPKTELIQALCEGKVAEAGNEFGVADIKGMLDSYWHLAVITAEEHRELLTGRKMPTGWTPKDHIFKRYEKLARMKGFRLYRSREDAKQCQSVLVENSVDSCN